MSFVASSDVNPSASDEEQCAPAPRNGVSATRRGPQGNNRSKSQWQPGTADSREGTGPQ
ncbi:hypothetical protein PCASD_26167, partial [Puccinia coronata f. sp. avenae]